MNPLTPEEEDLLRHAVETKTVPDPVPDWFALAVPRLLDTLTLVRVEARADAAIEAVDAEWNGRSGFKDNGLPWRPGPGAIHHTDPGGD